MSGTAAWWTVRPQLDRPYVYDEAAFAFAARAVAETGVPLSNVGHMQTETPGDFSQRFNWALWHPPLYVFLLGWAFSRGGESEVTARLLGVTCGALTASLVFALATLVLWRRSRAAPVYAATGTALYVTNPFVLQSALLLDIDGTVLVAAVTLLALAYVCLLSAPWPLASRRTWLLLGVTAGAFGLSLWAKMTTALALPAVAALYHTVARPWRPWRALVELPAVTLGGGLLFLVTWWLASAVKGMPFLLPFHILFVELRDAAGSTSAWLAEPRLLLELTAYVALWVSPYLIALFVWAVLARAYDLLARPFVAGARWALKRPAGGDAWGAWPIDFVMLCGATIATAYLIKLAASFPKYHITAMPFVAIAIAYLLWRYVRRLALWELPIYAIVLAGMAGYFVTFVGDSHILFRGWEFVVPLLVWPAALGAAFLVLSFSLGAAQLPRQLAIVGVLLTLSWSWGVNDAQVRAGYSTTYHYGTSGQRETAAYLDSILRPGQPYIAARDVAYYAGNQLYIDQDTWWEHVARLSQRGIPAFDGRIAGYDDVDVLVLFLWDPALGQIAHSYLRDRYAVSYQSGPFIVFVRQSR